MYNIGDKIKFFIFLVVIDMDSNTFKTPFGTVTGVTYSRNTMFMVAR